MRISSRFDTFQETKWNWDKYAPWALIRTISSLSESTFSSSCLFFCSTFCSDSVSDLIFASSWTRTQRHKSGMGTGARLRCCFADSPRPLPAYLGNTQLAGCHLGLHLVHLLAAVAQRALQLFAAFDHGLYLWLHFADVKTSHCELFVNQATALLLLLHQEIQVVRLTDFLTASEF